MNHSFDIETAKKYGVEEAVFIENMRFWIAKNMANERHFYDGRYWTYNSAKAFTQLFPYWSASQVNRIIKKLELAGVLLSGNFNQSAYDRTKWYSLNEEIHFTESQNGNHGIAKTLIRTDVNTDVSAASLSTKAERLSKEWFLPKTWGEWSINEFGWSVGQVKTEADKFKDYWIAKAGKDAAKLDWQATWRNWCRTAKIQPDKQNGSLLMGGI